MKERLEKKWEKMKVKAVSRITGAARARKPAGYKDSLEIAARTEAERLRAASAKEARENRNWVDRRRGLGRKLDLEA